MVEDERDDQPDEGELHDRPRGRDQQLALQPDPLPAGEPRGDQREHDRDDQRGHSTTRPSSSRTARDATRSACARSWVIIRIARPCCGKRAHERLDPGRGLGVERGGRLVEQQHARLAGQRAGDRHPRALADGERAGVAIEELDGQPRAHQRLGERGLGRRREPVGEVRAHVAGEHHRRLGDQRDALAQRARVERGDVHALELHPPRDRPVEADQAAQQARLPRARRPDQRGDRPGGNVERDVVEHQPAPALVAQAAYREAGRFS